MTTEHKPHSNPNVISEAVRRNGYCGEVSADGEWVCIKDAGHEDDHGDERWAGDDVSILRNYLFDGIGNAALDRLVEQYQTALPIIEAVAAGRVGPAHGVLARDLLSNPAKRPPVLDITESS